MKTVSIIGRPNTGKSTIFNLLTHSNISITLDKPGVTRDRIYGVSYYNEKKFAVIDTGGLELGEELFNKEILFQANVAIEESDLILFIVSGQDGITRDDILVRDLLHKSNKDVIVIVNKLDNNESEKNIYEFYELGFDKILPFSAAHKKNLNKLLDIITEDITVDLDLDNHICKFSIIGRPNTGKSSLVNAILNEERSIVSDVAGTTRDATNTEFRYDGNSYIIVDTAGIKRSKGLYDNIEKYSYLRSVKAITDSDVCVLMLDASTGIQAQDKHILGLALELSKAIVICVNKIDLLDQEELKKWNKLIEYEFQFVPYAKVVYLSALKKKRVHLLMPQVIEAYQNYNKQIKTSLLNKVIEDATAIHEAPSYKGRRLKIYFVSQVDICPPKFEFSVNDKSLIHFSYERYLENQIRKNFDLTGTPIILKFKNHREE